jgi:hypothetical protein
MVMTRTRGPWLTATVIAVAATVLLTGCNGGAQNIDPAGKKPGANEGSGSDQDGKVACTVIPDTALQTLTKRSSEGKIAVAYGRKVSGGWYLAGPIGDDTSYSSVIGLWATKGDVTSSDFGSPLYSLNKDARKATSFSTTAPSGFSASSAAARAALGCAKQTQL